LDYKEAVQVEFLKKIMFTFIYILAGITISASIFITIFIPDILFSIHLLWQIIGMSAVCSCGNFIYLSRNDLGKQQMKLRIILHYLYINVVVLTGAFLWEWLIPGYTIQILVMFLLIAAVYSAITIITFRQEERTAEKLNIRLRKMNSAEAEKEYK
jgi:hypothetical protein